MFLLSAAARFLKTYAWSLIWAGVIAYLSLTNSSNLPVLDWDFITPDKAGHFTVYAILSFLTLLGVAQQFVLSSKMYIAVIVGAAIYGFIMEWTQYLLTLDRCFEYPDMLANALGALLGAAIFYILHRKRA